LFSLCSAARPARRRDFQHRRQNDAANLPVRIGDIGTVLNSVKPVYTVVTANGKPAVLLNVNRQPDGNTVAVAEKVARRNRIHPQDAA